MGVPLTRRAGLGGPDPHPAARAGRADRRRRGGRAARLGGQGAGRERAGRRRAQDRGRARVGRAAADAGGGRRLRHDAGGGAAGPAAPRHLQAARAPRICGRLSTFGFRGEALPVDRRGVAAAALRPRPPESVAGFRLSLEGGREIEARETGMPDGTQIEVRDLFFNTPVRLKFLKAEATETGNVAESLLRLALANPGVHFRLRSDDRTLLDLPPVPQLAERVRSAARPPRHRRPARGPGRGERCARARVRGRARGGVQHPAQHLPVREPALGAGPLAAGGAGAGLRRAARARALPAGRAVRRTAGRGASTSTCTRRSWRCASPGRRRWRRPCATSSAPPSPAPPGWAPRRGPTACRSAPRTERPKPGPSACHAAPWSMEQAAARAARRAVTAGSSPTRAGRRRGRWTRRRPARASRPIRRWPRWRSSSPDLLTSGSCTAPTWSARRPARWSWSTSTPPTNGSPSSACARPTARGRGPAAAALPGRDRAGRRLPRPASTATRRRQLLDGLGFDIEPAGAAAGWCCARCPSCSRTPTRSRCCSMRLHGLGGGARIHGRRGGAGPSAGHPGLPQRRAGPEMCMTREEAVALLAALDESDFRSHCPTAARCWCASPSPSSSAALAGPDGAAARLVAILGPTASGKSALGLELAAAPGGRDPLLRLDAGLPRHGHRHRQAHRRPSARACPTTCSISVDPGEPFHAARWAAEARPAIAAIRAAGRLPIVVGGTGLYFRALVRGLFEAPPPDPAIRARHQEEAAAPRAWRPCTGGCAAIDPEAAARILPGRPAAHQPRAGGVRADRRAADALHRAAPPRRAGRRLHHRARAAAGRAAGARSARGSTR